MLTPVTLSGPARQAVGVVGHISGIGHPGPHRGSDPAVRLQAPSSWEAVSAVTVRLPPQLCSSPTGDC